MLFLTETDDPAIVGQKAARLARLIKCGFRVPRGFVVPVQYYLEHIRDLPTSEALATLDAEDFDSLSLVSDTIKCLILAKEFRTPTGGMGTMIVRSSALQEDTDGLSFAGLYDSFQGVTDEQLAHYIKLCWASGFTPRALSYRFHNNVVQDGIMGVIVQEMVEGTPGVLFTADPDTGAQEMLIELHPEGVVQGNTIPKQSFMTSRAGSRIEWKRELFRIGKALREMMQCEVDVEWVLDSKEMIHIVQVRPLRMFVGASRKASLHADLPILIGSPIGSKVVTGVVQKITDPQDASFKRGNILVVESTSPEWEPLMRRASALITDKGSKTSHAALVAREIGIPAVVGTMDATRYLATGQTVTIDGNFVYGGNPNNK